MVFLSFAVTYILAITWSAAELKGGVYAFKLCIGIEVWIHSTQFRYLAGVRNLVILNFKLNGKLPEDDPALKWEELSSGGHCPFTFTTDRTLDKAILHF